MWLALVTGSLAGVSHGAAMPPPLPSWQPSLYHKGWTRRDGAPSAVFSMTQDRFGKLWFTSNSGLYGFDGVKFERTDEIDGNKLSSPTTSAVTAIGDALWVGYSFGGLSVFQNGEVRHYGAAQGLPEHTVFQVGEAKDGTIWATCAEGLYWKDGDDWRKVPASDGLPAAGLFRYFTVLRDGSLLAYHQQGVYRNAAGTRRFRRVLAHLDVENGMLRRDGKVLVFTSQHQMLLFDPDNGRAEPLPLPKGSATPINVTLDSRDAIWINTEQGLQLLGPDLRPIRTFLAPDRLTGKLVYLDLSDREGNVWFVTENGVDQIREARLGTVELPPRMIGGLSVVAAKDGTVWIGNHPTTGNYNDTSFGLAGDGRRIATDMQDVTSTLRDPDGSSWFASDQFLWHQQGMRRRRWRLPAAVGRDQAQAMAMGRDGRLWVGMARHGLYTFKDGVWVAGGGEPALVGRRAVALHADAAGGIWFGYPGNRVEVLKDGLLRRFGADAGLAVGIVKVICMSAGRLWIGGDQGIAYMQGQRFIKLGGDGGVPLGGITGMVMTAGGELWLHGNDGLMRIGAPQLAAAVRPGASAVHLERFDYLDGHEGQPSAIRPLNSLAEGADGRLWYATSSSVGWIDPARIARNPLAPAPRVTALKTDRGAYQLRDGLRLPEHSADVQIDFTAAALSMPERVRFRYRLIGLDAGWREVGARRQAFYTNLGPGDYRFEVIAANEDGVWSKEAAHLAFHIEPSITQTLWFKLLCVALALGALYLLYLLRVAQITARVAERSRGRLLERERIARTLHDTFLQSVQALIMRFDLIRNTLPAGDPAQQRIDAALDMAQMVVDEGREQVLDLRVGDMHPGDLRDALDAVGRATGEQYGLAFSLALQGAARPLSAAVKAEVLAIGKEAIYNAARHGGGADVMVELAYSPGEFRMTVRDHGPGLDASVRETGKRPGHWGLEGMRERAQRIGGKLSIDSAPGAGVTVSFAIAARRAFG
ncbi:triple tyrosine motif-containing protein [Duganella sp. CT11-25]|uniref:sensor histidine kinase n=1 Tax=unclassified Duganella TaxID=2636909 RepID=UPI0039B0B93C